ncbi:MAG: DUF2066 domain-containing protein [Bdellovibrionales bacterium]|jgi:hypothetical protein
MRVVIFLVFSLFCLASPAWAQEDLAVYRIAGVTVDVTAANATVARDHAIMQAQRSAFSLLLERLGVREPQAKASDEALAALVQAFEIQNEHTAGYRYTGLFSVQFKPAAVRQWLGTLGVKYTENRAKSLVVLPIVKSKERATLWEDSTPWRSVWMGGEKNTGLVPFIVPTGDLEDIAQISTAEALTGKPEALEAVRQKYGAGGVLVAVLETDSLAAEGESPTPSEKGEGVVTARRYDEAGAAKDLGRLPVAWASLAQRGEVLAAAIRSLSQSLEADWRAVNKVPSGAVATLPVDVDVPTLEAWAQIRQRLTQVPAVASAQIVTMTRGLVHIELGFRGELAALPRAVAEQGLTLEQSAGGGWLLH